MNYGKIVSVNMLLSHKRRWVNTNMPGQVSLAVKCGNKQSKECAVTGVYPCHSSFLPGMRNLKGNE